MHLMKLAFLASILFLILSCRTPDSSASKLQGIQQLNIRIDTMRVGSILGLVDTTIVLRFEHESPLLVLHDSIAVKYFYVFNSRTNAGLFKTDYYWKVDSCWQRWFVDGYSTITTKKLYRKQEAYGKGIKAHNALIPSPFGEHEVQIKQLITWGE